MPWLIVHIVYYFYGGYNREWLDHGRYGGKLDRCKGGYNTHQITHIIMHHKAAKLPLNTNIINHYADAQ
jgi:hypothetical protein